MRGCESPVGGELLDHRLEGRGRDRELEEPARPAADVVLGAGDDLGHVPWFAPRMRWQKLTRSAARVRFGPNICSDRSAVARISSFESAPRETPTIR